MAGHVRWPKCLFRLFFFFSFFLRGIESHDLVELGPCLGLMAFERGAWGGENLCYGEDDLPSFQASKLPSSK